MYIIESILRFIIPLIAAIISLVLLNLTRWLLIGRFPHLDKEKRFPRQVILLILTISLLIWVVLTLPISEGSRNQIISLIGLLISGVIAFSSTNIVSNLMSGVLLRMTRPFYIGDFIRVGEYFGRVSDQGLFDTEIQNESRELIALPNTYLITNPVTTIRSSGTIVSATLSLGYDVHHAEIEALLIRAAELSGLEDGFVHILELGDYSISYRVSGLLKEVKGVLSARSRLYQSVLDTLHGDGVEIMSPAFMNQRRIPDDAKAIPAPRRRTPTPSSSNAEAIVFDKAEKAAGVEQEKQDITAALTALDEAIKQGDQGNPDQLKTQRAALQERLDILSIKPEDDAPPRITPDTLTALTAAATATTASATPTASMTPSPSPQTAGVPPSPFTSR